MSRRPKFDHQEAARLYAEGMTGKAIGFKLGVTDDAIFNALANMGIKRRKYSYRTPYLAKMQLGAIHSHEARAKKVKQEAAPSKPIIRDMGPAKPLTAPAWATCRFPMWPDGVKATGEFCGRPREIGSYCAEHAGRCYVKVRAA